MSITIIFYLLAIISVGTACYRLGYMNGWDKGIQDHDHIWKESQA